MKIQKTVVKLVYGIELGNTDDTIKFLYEIQNDMVSLYANHVEEINDIYTHLEKNDIEMFFLNLVAFEKAYFDAEPVVDLCQYNFENDKRYILHPVQLNKNNKNKCIKHGHDSLLDLPNKNPKISKKAKDNFYNWLGKFNIIPKFPIIVPRTCDLKWMVVSYTFNGEK
jgi:hypothetical protein